jgi:hypothetical protein
MHVHVQRHYGMEALNGMKMKAVGREPAAVCRKTAPTGAIVPDICAKLHDLGMQMHQQVSMYDLPL